MLVNLLLASSASMMVQQDRQVALLKAAIGSDSVWWQWLSCEPCMEMASGSIVRSAGSSAGLLQAAASFFILFPQQKWIL
jgi:hypothetical protein